MKLTKRTTIAVLLALGLALAGGSGFAAGTSADQAAANPDGAKLRKSPCGLRFTSWSGSHPTLYGEKDYSLRWEAPKSLERIDIYLLRNGSELGWIVQGTPNDGVCLWYVGTYATAGGAALAPEGEGYQVRVCSPDKSCCSLSGPFTIDDPKTLFTPDIITKLERRSGVAIDFPEGEDPSFALSEISVLIGDPASRYKVLLLKGGVALQELGAFGRGTRLPALLRARLGEAEARELRADSAAFALALADGEGRIIKAFPLEPRQR
jgi:hypothetical protein